MIGKKVIFSKFSDFRLQYLFCVRVANAVYMVGVYQTYIDSEIYSLREEIRQKSLLITLLISSRSTRESVDQQCA